MMIGNPTPDFTYGYSVNSSNTRISICTTSRVSTETIFNTSFLSAYAQYNYHTKRLGRWNGEGTSNWEPILDSSRATQMMNSSYFIEDGSYSRLKTSSWVTVSATGSSRRSVSKRCACS